MPTRKLQIEHVENKEKPGHVVVKMKGIIDEDADLSGFFPNLKGEAVVDLEGIQMINSAGVRGWVNAIMKLPTQTQLYFERCSPRIVEQLNYVSSFPGRGHVVSFFAPYFCPKCKVEMSALLTAEDVKRRDSKKPPAQKCAKCKGVMDFDDVPEEYFSFLFH